MVYTEVGWASDETHPLSQANMKTVDAGIADIHESASVLVHQGSANDVGSVDVDATAGPFSAGDFRALRLVARGSMNDVSYMVGRVNNDSTAELHQSGAVVTRASDGAVVDSVHGDFTTWRLARWSTIVCSLDMFMIPTHISSLFNFHGHGVRPSDAAANHQFTRSGGRLTLARQITSIRLFPLAPATQFTVIGWQLYGWR